MKKSCHQIRPNEVEDLLKEKGLHITQAKKDILTELLKSSEPLSAQELTLIISNINESTIFRNLKQLKEHLIIHEIDLNEGHKRYELNPQNHHHHHIQCRKCGNIQTLHNCHIQPFIKEIKSLGFKDIEHSLEFNGLCHRCQ